MGAHAMFMYFPIFMMNSRDHCEFQFIPYPCDTHACTHTHARTHTHMHTHTHARTHARMHARTHTHSCTYNSISSLSLLTHWMHPYSCINSHHYTCCKHLVYVCIYRPISHMCVASVINIHRLMINLTYVQMTCVSKDTYAQPLAEWYPCSVWSPPLKG